MQAKTKAVPLGAVAPVALSFARASLAFVIPVTLLIIGMVGLAAL